MSDHDGSELEENRDGLMLLLFGAVAIGLLCAAGAGVYFAANKFLGEDAPAQVAEVETEPTHQAGDVSAPASADVTPATVASATEPAAKPEEPQTPTEEAGTANVAKKVWPPKEPTGNAAAPTEKEGPPVKKPEAVATTTPPVPKSPATPPKPAPSVPKPVPSVTPDPAPPTVAAAKPEPAKPAAAKPATTKPAVPPREVAKPEPANPLRRTETERAAVVTAAGEPLAYNWAPGRIHSWKIAMTADFEDETVTVNGHTQLSIGTPVRPPQATALPEAEATGSGTGFVVSSDGYLVTCAHLVQGASKVEVQIGKDKYVGKVIATVGVDDLAIVKIEAKDLPALSIADSSSVQLGEEIRAIGFPLTDVLGEGLKATRGTIAGIIQKQNGTRFQIDAAINPGNSGGPVVNQRGEIIGVASSKLVGLQISRLGFCIPSERVSALLKKEKVEGTAAKCSADLSLSRRSHPQSPCSK
jgi:S1-C subfamily serine protease